MAMNSKKTQDHSIKLQPNHHFISPDSLIWFDNQYQPGADGWFVLGYKKRRSDNIYPLYAANRNGTIEFLSKMHVSKDTDYYITANSFFGNKKKTDRLWELHNIVIDIDAHVETQSAEDLIAKFLWRLDRDLLTNGDLPVPTSVISTGRGIQLWWSIEPTSSKCLAKHKEVLAALSDAIDRFIKQYPSELLGLDVDKSASQNPAGYFRLPGTWNTKAEQIASIIRCSLGTYYSFQDMIDWAKAYRNKHNLPMQPYSNANTFVSQYSDAEFGIMADFETAALFRIQQLINLRIIRDAEPGNETRNNYCHIFYSTVLRVKGPDIAWEQLKQFNAEFKVPMTEQELHNSIDHATKLGGYKFTNKTIIDILNITEEEQQILGLFPVKKYEPRSNHPARSACTQMKRTRRAAKVLELHKQGKTQAEISSELNISRPTIIKVLKQHGLLDCSARGSRKKQAKKLLAQGKSVRETASILGVSEQTIRNYKKAE